MDKLQWFKFSPSSWMMGRIQRCSDNAQGRFIRLCCSYWNHGCEMLSEDAKLDLGLDIFNELIKNRVIYTDDEYIYIRFLDDQYSDIEKTSNKGKLYALKRWKPEEYKKIMGLGTVKEPNDAPMGTHKNPNAEERREEKKREEKNNIDARKLTFKKSLYVYTDDYRVETLKAFFEYWTEHGDNDKKMRFEKEKSFGTSRRLSTWAKNDFDKTESQGKEQPIKIKSWGKK